MSNKNAIIEGIAAPLPIANLDTDQIMPKQFLRGIDKAGLDRGLLYDLRFDPQGKPRADFVLNRPEYANTSILLGGPNFGCGSSREHAVWGLRQFGIRAVIAPSFGEIFYSNAMNNGLMLVMLPGPGVQKLMDEAACSGGPPHVRVDVENLIVTTRTVSARFTLSERHRSMLLHGLDMLGASLRYKQEIKDFAVRWHGKHPWLKDIASVARSRLDGAQERTPGNA
ncbi:MAG: 3-isopropylmalate dehydratase small subunit [Noviherbaspirillum sp.]